MSPPESDLTRIGFPKNTVDAAAARHRLLQSADAGLFRHALPQAVGGHGDSFSDLCRRHEALGLATADPGLVLAVNAHLWGALFPVYRYASERVSAEYLPPLLSGALIGGHAITEPDAGSDLQALAARADPVPGGFVLHGTKRYITNAPIADVMVVYVRLDAGITGFLVRRDDPGADFVEAATVAACRGATMGEVRLDGCRLDAERMLGRPGAGAMLIQHALEFERAFIFAGIVGVMEWQLREVVAHSRRRRAGGTHLGRHQAVSHRIADMKLRTDSVRLWVQECARLCDLGRRVTLSSAQTKLFAAEAFLQSSLDAVQIFGAKGLEGSHPLAAMVQDAMAGRLFSGTSDIQRNIIAALLGTGDGYRGPEGSLSS